MKYYKTNNGYIETNGIFPGAIEISYEEYLAGIEKAKSLAMLFDRYANGEIALDDLPEKYHEEAIAYKDSMMNPILQDTDALNIILGND